jgi:beta-glucanase (GH16 family)
VLAASVFDPARPSLPAHRTRKRLPFLLALLAAAALVCNAQNPSSILKDKRWKLVWSDEFNGPDGPPVDRSKIDRSKWALETGSGVWGNEELEYYTDRPANVFLRNGNLVIRALKEKFPPSDPKASNYTSARLKTLGKFSRAYGRFEARIKLPFGQGMWPAFWMLGDDIDKAGWPACGEIDIMENIGKEPSLIHGSIHGPGYTGNVGIEAPYSLPGGQRFGDDFHVFAVEWSPDSVAFFVDQTMYVKRTRADLRPGWKWVFDKPFFLILNLAVGGDWPGAPDSSTRFPQEMLVDYVRVYEPTTSKGSLQP